LEKLPGRGSSNISSVVDTKTNGVGGLNSLASGLGECVLNISASDLGDGVTVLNLDGNNLNLGVINTVSGGNLTASVLHGGDSRVGNGVSNGGNMGNGSDGGVGKRSDSGVSVSVELSISIGFSISLSLDNMAVGGGSITQNINNILADLLVLNLFSLNNLGGAHVIGMRGTGLCDKDFLVDNAVGGSSVVSDRGDGSGMSNGYGSSTKVASITQELGVSLSIGLGGRSCMGSDGKEDNGDELVHDEIILHFPRCSFELK